jgi:hypothetical protein
MVGIYAPGDVWLLGVVARCVSTAIAIFSKAQAQLDCAEDAECFVRIAAVFD